MFFTFVANQLLIQLEIHLVRSNGAGIIFTDVNFVCNLLQRRKGLLDRLLHENAAVSKVQNLTLHTALQQTIYNLKCSIGLADTSSITKSRPLCCKRATKGSRIKVKVSKSSVSAPFDKLLFAKRNVFSLVCTVFFYRHRALKSLFSERSGEQTLYLHTSDR